MSSPGDVIGIESCVDLLSNDDFAKYTESSSTAVATGGHRSFTRAKVTAKQSVREYPPPLPTAWELRRYYTNDGRLIIKEEKARSRQREVFRADRSNGRLTLHLVREESDNGDVLWNEGVFEMENVSTGN